jgi:hypothetical protein
MSAIWTLAGLVLVVGAVLWSLERWEAHRQQRQDAIDRAKLDKLYPIQGSGAPRVLKGRR